MTTPGRDGAARRICLIGCTNSDSFYVTAGDCPSGPRCFHLGNRALCLPDCRGPEDCATGECDMDGSCTLP